MSKKVNDRSKLHQYKKEHQQVFVQNKQNGSERKRGKEVIKTKLSSLHTKT